MNPDMTSPAYQIIQAGMEREARAESIRKRELHNKAVKRRRAAKRGGR